MIRNVLFDMGNVLIRFDPKQFLDRLQLPEEEKQLLMQEVFRSVEWVQMDPFVEEASINLGVSPMKTFFTVTARMMLPGVMSGAVLSWITCINELSSSIMLYSGKTSTIAVAIYQEVTRMSDGTAAALATILTVTTIISLLIVFRLTKGKVKIV